MLEKWDSIVMGKKYFLSYVEKMLSLCVNFVEMVWFILGAKYNFEMSLHGTESKDAILVSSFCY